MAVVVLAVSLSSGQTGAFFPLLTVALPLSPIRYIPDRCQIDSDITDKMWSA